MNDGRIIPVQAIVAQQAVAEAMANPNHTLVQRARAILDENGNQQIRAMHKLCTTERNPLGQAVAAVRKAARELGFAVQI